MKGMKVIGRAGALALLIAATGASAEEGEAMKSILGAIGIIPKEKAPIVYNERAPLVLPPKMDLPAPAPGGGAEARNGNWPKDPDVAARRKAAAEARTPYTSSDYYKNTEGKRLSIEEMRAGRNPNASTVQQGPVGRQADISRMTPDELRAFTKDEKPELQGNGIDRRYLSDPPGDLLRAQGGGKIKASADPIVSGDPDSPSAYLRQRQSRQ
ncbi:hypothetical protein [Microvirga mediterraneensis]|uniref:DUF3035 domain-containing protein n=1 Tax=Microvirga mediterraneensis TaxID=2754695 RepID=A0A838BVB1_9HYPH|nr:hypothetical protein [Microvirga mediterraneensis]MBA1158436.1 hypothetical protein [Microvirga mediterraneensis]